MKQVSFPDQSLEDGSASLMLEPSFTSKMVWSCGLLELFFFRFIGTIRCGSVRLETSENCRMRFCIGRLNSSDSCKWDVEKLISNDSEAAGNGAFSKWAPGLSGSRAWGREPEPPTWEALRIRFPANSGPLSQPGLTSRVASTMEALARPG